MRQSLKDVIANIKIKAEKARIAEEERKKAERLARIQAMPPKDRQRYMYLEFLELMDDESEKAREKVANLITESWKLYLAARVGARFYPEIKEKRDRLAMIKSIASNFHNGHPEPYTTIIHHRNFGAV
jgi:hypothetical protein